MRREAADNPAAAIGCVILGVGLLTSGDVIAKTVTAHLTPFAYIFLRSMFAFLPVLAALTIARCWGRLRTRHPWAQAARGLSMAVAYNCYLQALQAMPIADVTALFFIAPFLVAPLSHFFLGERVPLSRWGAIAVAFAGVLVIVQPGTEAFRPEGLWCIAGALAAAVTALLARRLGGTEPAAVTSFYTTLAFLLAGAIPVLFLPGHALDPTGSELMLAGLAGLIAGTAHFLIILAYRRGEASLVAPFEYTALIVAIAFGYLFFGDIPGPPVWLGMALIVAAGIVLARRSAVPPRSPADQPL
ncbi:MAG: DMT family transporter [Proteobacteria bacterium]|nr:DMT family transporter [Pseudomonadota bacterium]